MASETVPISEREREILRLVATGATNQQIAHQLNISVNTVKVHLKNIFGKIGVASRTEATLYAIRLGLVDVEGQQSGAAALEIDPGAPPASLVGSDVAIEPPLDGQIVLVGAAPVTAALEDGAAILPAERPGRRRALWLAIAGAAALIVVGAVSLLLWRPVAAPPQGAATAAAPTSAWKARAPLPRPRDDFAVTADYDGKLYVFGGSDARGPTTAVDRYDPANNVWVELSDMPSPLTRAQAVTIGGRIYLPGGEGPGGAVLDSFSVFDPRSQQWEELPSLPEPRSRYALAAFEGRLYLFGGWDGSRVRAEVFAFDPQSGTWTEETSLPTPRSDAAAAVLRGRLYVVGGTGANGPLKVNERFDPTSGDQGQWTGAAPLPDPIASPAAVGLPTAVIVFDQERRAAVQYSAELDAWQKSGVPDDVALSSRIAGGSTVFVFGPADAVPPAALSEYQAIFTTFLPGVGR